MSVLVLPVKYLQVLAGVLSLRLSWSRACYTARAFVPQKSRCFWLLVAMPRAAMPRASSRCPVLLGLLALACLSRPSPSPAAFAAISPISEGSNVPSVTFKTRTRTEEKVENPFDWKDLTSEELFKGKRVVVFALPGAFTPTCSSTHLPGYENKYDEIKALGIDEVYCLSVNDAFVMRQWGLGQGLEEDKTPGSLGFRKVKLLPDGACLFTRGMGMSCVWDSERGFGERSWRYSMVVNDMKVARWHFEKL